jgi:hypothetical protein
MIGFQALGAVVMLLIGIIMLPFKKKKGMRKIYR